MRKTPNHRTSKPNAAKCQEMLTREVPRRAYANLIRNEENKKHDKKYFRRTNF